MNQLKQPNRWSCLPTAFAMVLDLDVGTIIEQLGHDGSTIVFPHLAEPECRAGFHVQELVQLSWEHGWAVTHFQIMPQMLHGTEHRSIYTLSTARVRIDRVMAQASGVLTGLNDNNNHHAVAWDSETRRIFDPS